MCICINSIERVLYMSVLQLVVCSIIFHGLWKIINISPIILADYIYELELEWYSFTISKVGGCLD